MPIIDHFSFLAPFYEHVIRLGDMKAFITRAALPTDGWLLDAGGGTGRVAHALREQASHRVVADVSLGMLAEARAKGGLHSVGAVTESLPFPDNTFDRVIMVDALHHVADQSETAQEMWRVIRPGGRILIEELNLRTMTVKLVALAEKLALMRSHFLTISQIVALFPAHQARIRVETEGYNAWIMIDKPG